MIQRLHAPAAIDTGRWLGVWYSRAISGLDGNFIVRFLRMLYCVVAFSGAVLMHVAGGDFTLVHAQSRDYGLESRVDVDAKMVDQLAGRTDQIDRHLEATDKSLAEMQNRMSDQVKDLSDRISLITGIGSGISVTLGGIQLLTVFFGKVAKGP